MCASVAQYKLDISWNGMTQVGMSAPGVIDNI